MKHMVWLVRGQDGSYFGWLVDPPLAGCHARGTSRDSVLATLPGQVDDFLDVLNRGWPDFDTTPYRPTGLEVAEELSRRGSALDGSMHLFPAERMPPRPEEVSERLRILSCTRNELLSVACTVPEAGLDWQEPAKPETHTIRRQLRHVADVERWYLGRLWRGLPPLVRSHTVWERLERTRALAETWLSNLPSSNLARVERHVGELWSMRKILRRLVYHEWFHLQVVRRIAGGYREHSRADGG
ncbi:MAG: DinB family protein [Trueperaceae bacterium]